MHRRRSSAEIKWLVILLAGRRTGMDHFSVNGGRIMTRLIDGEKKPPVTFRGKSSLVLKIDGKR